MTSSTPWAHGVRVAEGVDLHVVEWRPATQTAADLLLVHGLASNAQLWTGLAQVLVAAGHRVVAVDQRGHGLSSKPDDGYDFPRLVEDLASVIGALGLQRPIAVGQSWGGNVVLELAATRPSLVRGIACIDGGHIELAESFEDEASMREILRPPPLAGMRRADLAAGMAGRMDQWPDTALPGQMANFATFPDGTVTAHLTLERHMTILGHLWSHHPSDRFADVQVPVLLLPVRGGPGGGVGNEAAVERAAALLPRSQTHWFDGSHDIHAQAPCDVATVLQTACDERFFDDADAEGE